MTLKAKWPFDISSIRQEFRDIDEDGSGTISKAEFLKVLQQNCNLKSIEPLREILQQFKTSSYFVNRQNDSKTEFVTKMMKGMFKDNNS